MRKVTFFVLLTAMSVLAACSNYSELLKSSDIGYKYEAAKEYYANGQYNRASQLLQTIITTLKGSDKGQESLYLFGLCNYYSGD